MGWTSFNIQKNEKTKDILRRENEQQFVDGEQYGFTIIEDVLEDDAHFAIVEIQDKDTSETKNFCMITLVERTEHENSSELSYKGMGESEGPYALCSSPIFMTKLEKLIPEAPNEFAKNWREASSEIAFKKAS